MFLFNLWTRALTLSFLAFMAPLPLHHVPYRHRLHAVVALLQFQCPQACYRRGGFDDTYDTTIKKKKCWASEQFFFPQRQGEESYVDIR